jgi:hypothetical protein
MGGLDLVQIGIFGFVAHWFPDSEMGAQTRNPSRLANHLDFAVIFGGPHLSVFSTVAA